MNITLKEAFENAVTLYNNKKYDDSKTLFELLITRNYEADQCYYYLGLIFLAFNNRKAAELKFLRCEQINPNNFYCLYSLGVFYEDNNIGLALEYFNKTLYLNPNYIDAQIHKERLLRLHYKMEFERKKKEQAQIDLHETMRKADEMRDIVKQRKIRAEARSERTIQNIIWYVVMIITFIIIAIIGVETCNDKQLRSDNNIYNNSNK